MAELIRPRVSRAKSTSRRKISVGVSKYVTRGIPIREDCRVTREESGGRQGEAIFVQKPEPVHSNYLGLI